MKTSTKMGMTLTFSLAFLLLFTVPNAYAGSCQYNTGSGDYASSEEFIHQDVIPYADNLEFTAHLTEWDVDHGYYVNGYRVTIDCFPTVECEWGDTAKHHYSVDVRASGANIPYCTYCRIKVEFWENSLNSIHKKDMRWSKGVDETLCLPDHGWKVVPGGNITIFNDDDSRNFTISDFGYHVDTALHLDLTTIVFGMSIPGNFTLLPGGNRTFNISLGGIREGYVYFHYTMLNATGGVLSEEYAAHEMPSAVGGVVVSVDKFVLLAPYIVLASTILATTAATAIYVKRRKKKQ